MSNNNEKERSEQNISDVLEKLKKSVDSEREIKNDYGNTNDTDTDDGMSDEDLKQKLRERYSVSEDKAYEAEEDAYRIDDDFFDKPSTEPKEDVKTVFEQSEEPEETPEEEPEETLEEEPEETLGEEPEEAFEGEPEETLEEEPEEAFEGEPEETLEEEPEETLEEEPEEILEEEPKETPEEEPEEAFEEEIDGVDTDDEPLKLEGIRDAEKEFDFFDPSALKLTSVTEFTEERNDGDTPSSEKTEKLENQYTSKYDAPYTANIEDNDTAIEDNDTVKENETEKPLNEISPSEPSEDEVCEEDNASVDDGDNDGEEPKITGSELSLLLQFGCNDEILDMMSDEEIREISETESLDTVISEEKNENETVTNSEIGGKSFNTEEVLEEKITGIYERKRKERGGILVRLLISSAIAVLIFFYDLLSALGAELPGIMNKNEYFVSFVLIGFQLLIMCAATSVPQIWDGLKRLFTRRANAYSMVSAALIMTAVYDLAIMVAQPFECGVYHFAAAIIIVLTVASECVEITSEIDSLGFFFSDYIQRGRGEVIISSEEREKTYTLQKSNGRNSVAEKMYRGGLNSRCSVYVPIETETMTGYFTAAEKESKRKTSPLVMTVPVITASAVAGILTFVFEKGGGEVWNCLGMILASLMLSMPVIVTASSCLPFALFNRMSCKSGFSFAGEQSAEQYADCDIFVFRDMHLFEKCSPKNVNLAIYDATSGNVLISCLDALYSCIGGPLGEAFSGGKNKSVGKCRVTRVAKSGVEAVIGSNYSLLVGSEQFMSRYGINFPAVNFKNQGDESFSLCVSLNGRPSARIFVKYKVNEMFEMLAERLSEDKIYCAVETCDPLINTELLARLRGENGVPVSVIHQSVNDADFRYRTRKEGFLFDAENDSMGVVAKRSRLNLVVAASGAKRMKKLRNRVNLLCYAVSLSGIGLSFLGASLGWGGRISEFAILLCWVIAAGGLAALLALYMPRKNRFSMNTYRKERERTAGKSDENINTKEN